MNILSSKNNSKKALSVLLALFMMMGAAGCGSGDAGAKKPDDTSSGAGSQAAENRDPLAPFAEPVTIRTVITAGTPPTDVTDPNIKPETMLFTKLAKEKFNINVEYMWAVPEEQYDQKLSVTLAAGDLPDVLNVTPQIYEQLRENDLLQDLNPSMDLFYPTLKTHVERLPDLLEIFVGEDGKRYGLPQYWDSRRSLIQMGIRQDWLDKLGLSAPQTVEELAAVMEAFTTKDPDGNGKDDTLGVALSKSTPADALGGNTMGALFNLFGAYPNYWIDDGAGNLVEGGTLPQMKDALRFINEQYAKGTLDKEFITKDATKLSEEMANNRYGIFFSHWWYPGTATFNTSVTNDPNARWTFHQIPGVGGPGKTVVNRYTVEQIFVATENCPNTDAYIKLMNLCTMMEEDPETHFGIPRDKALETRVWNWESPFFFFDPMDINNEHTLVNEANETGNTDKLTIGMKKQLTGLKEYDRYVAGELKWGESTEYPKGWGAILSRIAKDGAWANGAEIYAKGADGVTFSEYYGSATETQKERGATLKKLSEETFTKMAIGQQSIDEFDKYVEDWYKLGGEDITKEMNDWYAANKG